MLDLFIVRASSNRSLNKIGFGKNRDFASHYRSKAKTIIKEKIIKNK